MSKAWKSGDFDRTRLSPALHPFAPAHAADSLEQVDLKRLWERGKRLILLDVDNTLVEWKGENFAPTIIEWLDQAKSMGFQLCILSNTRRVERLGRITQLLDIPTVRGRFKPSRAMYRLALIKFHMKPEQAIMIGDQMMTDILGANRAGVDAIWVRKMASKEFGPTRINRFIEGLLTGPIYRSIVTPLDEHGGPGDRQLPVTEQSLFHQLVKFGMVGGIAFIIDYSVSALLLRGIHVDGQLLSHRVGGALRKDLPAIFGGFNDDQKAAAPIAFIIASLVAMTASFFMNRAWTFEVKGREERLKQARRFYAVSIMGSLINSGISSVVFNLLPSGFHLAVLLSRMCGAAVGAVWNFLGSRYYAFRR